MSPGAFRKAPTALIILPPFEERVDRVDGLDRVEQLEFDDMTFVEDVEVFKGLVSNLKLHLDHN